MKDLSERRSLNAVSQREMLFVREYLIDMHPANAAMRAGYSGSTGAALMKRTAIKDAINRALAERAARVGISADRILDELGNVMFANPAELFDERGQLKPLSELGPDQAKLIVGMKTRRAVTMGEDGKMQPEEITEYKFIDKLAALTLGMRHLGMFKDTLTIDVTRLADRLTAAQRRIGVTASAPEEPGEIEGEFEEIEPEEELNAEDYIE